MKFGKILLPLVLLGLAACGSSPSASAEPDSAGTSAATSAAATSAGTSAGASVGTSAGVSVAVGETATVTKTVAELATANAWVNATAYLDFNLDAAINVKASGTKVGDFELNTGKYYSGGSGTYRLYGSESGVLTIAAATGFTLESIKLTYELADVTKPVELKAGATVFASGAATAVSGTSIAITTVNTTELNGQARITAFSVTYKAV